MEKCDENRIKKLLTAMYNMSQREDWDESEAQELIMWGADMYMEYFKDEDTDNTDGLLECEDCHKKSVDVVETFCPYLEDVCGEEVLANLCTACYNERAADI